MAGDRARLSYDRTRKWRGPVAQQGRVTVEADVNEAATIAAERDRLTTLDVVGPVGTPDQGYSVTANPSDAVAPAIPGDLQIGAGTIYLGGERLDLDAAVTYSAQPDWLDYSTDPLWEPPAVPSAASPSYELVYLHAAEQEVSAVEDPALADVALGGPDTMQRLRVLQHFVRTPATSGTCGGAWQEFTGSLGAKGLQFDAQSRMIKSTTSLQVSFTNVMSTPGPCQPVATGGYLGAENQLIRVMVTDVKAGVPTIVWGFDNASFIYRISAATYDSNSGKTTLTLASSPVDSYHYPASGQAVELLRDAVALTSTDYIASPRGFVSNLTANYDPLQMQLVIAGEPPAGYMSAATPQLYLRVWQSAVPAPAGEAIALGDTGLAVTLESSNDVFHCGDFWLFAVRPINPSIVYPARYLAGPQPPEGPRTWACPLAVLTWENGSATASSCVPPFSSLVQLSGADSCGCTIDVGPSDLAGGKSLSALVANYAGRGPISVCLQPGTYTLAEPLVLGTGLDGITLRACDDGVVLQAPSDPGPEFTLGLIVVQGIESVSIEGIGLTVPLVGFSASSDAFTGLPGANQQLLRAYTKGLQIAIGISASNATGLTVADCSFGFPAPGEANILGAGVYATGAMDDLTLTGCTFESANPPGTVPFYDLAAGNPTEPPYQVTFGYLQVPAMVSEDAAAATVSPQLHDAVIERCLFQGVTVPVLAMTQLGTLRIDQNTVRSSYGGFWLVSLNNPAQITLFDALAVGNSAIYQDVARAGLAALADRILVLATAVGRVLPTTPPAGESTVVGRILAPGIAQLALARQTFSTVYAQAVATASASSDTSQEPTAGETTAAESGAVTPTATPAATTSVGIEHAGLLSDINTIFEPSGEATSEEVVPTADTGTSVSLRLDVCECQVDAVIANSYSGAGLMVTDLTQAGASVLVHGSRFRSRFPSGETVMGVLLAEATVTGCIVANEVTPPPKPTDREANSYSIALSVITPLGVPAVAITGNVFIDPTRLPARPATIPQPLGDWDVLNTVIDYVAPPVVTGLSETRGSIIGNESVAITGSGFTGATGVNFGTTAVKTMTVDSDGQITATSPPHSAGTVDVTVITPVGTSATSSADQFTYFDFRRVADVEEAATAAEAPSETADQPTPETTGEPTPETNAEPTPEPAAEPTPEPPAEPAPEPADEPTPEPADEATPEPADEPTPEPADEPTSDTVDDAAEKVTQVVPTAPASPLLRLQAISGADAGRSFDLNRGEQIIGREEDSDIQLQDGSVSHTHAVVRVRGARTTIEDLHSTNGTRVNDVPTQGRVSLAPGDHIDLGGVRLAVEQQPPAPEGEA